jgi:prophage maintenance system killer protein
MTFLSLNGHDVLPSEAELLVVWLDLAAGRVDEQTLAACFRSYAT